MKSTAFIASLAAATTEQDESCCFPKPGIVQDVGVSAGLPSGAATTVGDLPPTDKDFLCGPLRQTWYKGLQQCKVDVAGYFEDLPGYPKSRHNVNIHHLERRIDKAFHNYCGLDNHDYSAFLQTELRERERVQRDKRGKCQRQKKDREEKEKNECKRRKDERKKNRKDKEEKDRKDKKEKKDRDEVEKKDKKDKKDKDEKEKKDRKSKSKDKKSKSKDDKSKKSKSKGKKSDKSKSKGKKSHSASSKGSRSGSKGSKSRSGSRGGKNKNNKQMKARANSQVNTRILAQMSAPGLAQVEGKNKSGSRKGGKRNSSGSRSKSGNKAEKVKGDRKRSGSGKKSRQGKGSRKSHSSGKSSASSESSGIVRERDGLFDSSDEQSSGWSAPSVDSVSVPSVDSVSSGDEVPGNGDGDQDVPKPKGAWEGKKLRYWTAAAGERDDWPVQPEFDVKGWYGDLVVPMGRSWLWCKQAHNHGIDLLRAHGHGELAYHAKTVFEDNKARHTALVDQVNTHRLIGNNWQRFSLHINELKKISDRYEEVFAETIADLERLGLPSVNKNGKAKPATLNFCTDTFESDLAFIRGYEKHAHYFQQIHQNAVESPEGNTGAEHDDLVAAREFMWESWRRIKGQFECARASCSDDKVERLEANFQKIRKRMVQPTHKHSLRCYFRLFLKRTTWKRVVKTETVDAIAQQCRIHATNAMHDVEALIEEANEDGKWLAKSCGCKTSGYLEAIENLEDFLTKWNRVSDSIYSDSTKPGRRVKLIRSNANAMARIFRDYSRFGLRAGRVFSDDDEVQEIAARVETRKVAFKSECIDELRHIEHLLTPNYRNINGKA